MPRRSAPDLFGGVDHVRDLILGAIRMAKPKHLAPLALGKVADLDDPSVAVLALDGHPEKLTPAVAFALMASLGVSVDRVLQDPKFEDKAEAREWLREMERSGSGPVAAKGITFDRDRALCSYLRSRAIEGLAS